MQVKLSLLPLTTYLITDPSKTMRSCPWKEDTRTCFELWINPENLISKPNFIPPLNSTLNKTYSDIFKRLQSCIIFLISLFFIFNSLCLFTPGHRPLFVFSTLYLALFDTSFFPSFPWCRQSIFSVVLRYFSWKAWVYIAVTALSILCCIGISLSSIERPQKRWIHDIKERIRRNWYQTT